MYFSDRSVEFKQADKITVVLSSAVTVQPFQRSNYAKNIQTVLYDPGNLPADNFYFLIKYADAWHHNTVDTLLNNQISNPLFWGGDVAGDCAIPQEVCARVQRGTAKILVHNDHINVDEKLTNAWIDWAVKRTKLKHSDFVFLLPAVDYRNDRFIANNTWENQIESLIVNQGPDAMMKLHNNTMNGVPRQHKFVCLNYRTTLSRLLSAIKLFEYRDTGILTYQDNQGSNKTDALLDLVKDKYPKLVAKYRKICNEFPLVYDIDEDEVTYEKIALIDTSVVPGLLDNQDCYLNIVTETNIKNLSPIWFSEKTFRPIMLYQPFVLLSSCGALAALRSEGFATFDQWIDESYDLIEDDTERMVAALDAAIDFFTQDEERLIEIMKEMLPKLHHNRRQAELRYSKNSIDVLAPLVSYLNNKGSTTPESLVGLVYDNRYPQQATDKNEVSPFTISEYYLIFNASLAEEPLPDSNFYFQPDRELLDLAWMEFQCQQVHGNNSRYGDFIHAIQRFPAGVIERLRNKTAKILVEDHARMSEGEVAFKQFLEMLGQYIDPTLTIDDFVTISPSYRNRTDIQNVIFNFWEIYYIKNFIANYPKLDQDIVSSIRKRKHRKNKFICLMSRPSEIRMLTATMLWEEREQGIMTFPTLAPSDRHGPLEINTAKQLFSKFSLVLSARFFRDIEPELPLIWDIDQRMSKEINSLPEIYNQLKVWSLHKSYVDEMLDCYLNIITETHYLDVGPVTLSEKTFKAICHMMPFIIIGQHGALKALRDLGYKTFSQWIDESYDDIEDTLLRTFTATNEAKRIIAMPPEQLNDMLIDMLPVLIHNKKLAEFRYYTAWDQMGMELSYFLHKGVDKPE